MAATCNVSALVAAAPKVCVRTTAKVHASRAFLGRAAPLKAQVAGSTKGAQRLVVRADTTPSVPTSHELNAKLKEVTETVKDVWSETDDKPAVVTLAVYGMVGLIAANGVLKSIDGLPLIPDLLELVGIGFSTFYVYQNLLFKPDRAALKDSISKNLDKIL
mmetsp:Transcript_15710/g.38132  ORF Transcript_15710/g.38132 Transcript_15710/m.38132 type:complete len:161 (+) Transcript_15710:536-1018(+)